jgi:hypothetical protein
MGLSRYKGPRGSRSPTSTEPESSTKASSASQWASTRRQRAVPVRGGGTMMHVYLSPEHAGKSTATLAGWGVDDVEGL